MAAAAFPKMPATSEWAEMPKNIGPELSRGTFGNVYSLLAVDPSGNLIIDPSGKHVIDPTKVVKFVSLYRVDTYGYPDVRAMTAVEKNVVAEVTIQQQLYARVPESCPKILSFKQVFNTNNPNVRYCAIVMERAEGTAESFLSNNAGNDNEVLDLLEQVAIILQKAQSTCEFNHRDLKANNIMYKTVNGKKQYLLVDFGFSCATFDGKKFEGSDFFPPGQQCLRPSRDLAFLIYKTYLQFHMILTPKMKSFFDALLTIPAPAKECRMLKGCAGTPAFKNRVEAAEDYTFLNTDGTDNPKTTPEGLLNEIKAYREKNGLLAPAPVPAPAPAPAPAPEVVPPPAPPTPEAEAQPVGTPPEGARQTWNGGKKKRQTRRLSRKRATRKLKRSTR